MDMQYQLKAGSYYLYDMRDTPSAVTGERRFKLKTDTVAIAFDVHTGEVHQHGSPTRIQSWANNTRRRLRAAGAQDVANDIVVVSGPLPVDELKIDKSFVMGMEAGEDDAMIVRSTIDLAHNLGLTVVAEGVETAAILARLRTLACD